jgi:hypothetical protein
VTPAAPKDEENPCSREDILSGLIVQEMALALLSKEVTDSFGRKMSSKEILELETRASGAQIALLRIDHSVPCGLSSALEIPFKYRETGDGSPLIIKSDEDLQFLGDKYSRVNRLSTVLKNELNAEFDRAILRETTGLRPFRAQILVAALGIINMALGVKYKDYFIIAGGAGISYFSLASAIITKNTIRMQRRLVQSNQIGAARYFNPERNDIKSSVYHQRILAHLKKCEGP